MEDNEIILEGKYKIKYLNCEVLKDLIVRSSFSIIGNKVVGFKFPDAQIFNSTEFGTSIKYYTDIFNQYTLDNVSHNISDKDKAYIFRDLILRGKRLPKNIHASASIRKKKKWFSNLSKNFRNNIIKKCSDGSEIGNRIEKYALEIYLASVRICFLNKPRNGFKREGFEKLLKNLSDKETEQLKHYYIMDREYYVLAKKKLSVNDRFIIQILLFHGKHR